MNTDAADIIRECWQQGEQDTFDKGRFMELIIELTYHDEAGIAQGPADLLLFHRRA